MLKFFHSDGIEFECLYLNFQEIFADVLETYGYETPVYSCICQPQITIHSSIQPVSVYLLRIKIALHRRQSLFNDKTINYQLCRIAQKRRNLHYFLWLKHINIVCLSSHFAESKLYNHKGKSNQRYKVSTVVFECSAGYVTTTEHASTDIFNITMYE